MTSLNSGSSVNTSDKETLPLISKDKKQNGQVAVQEAQEIPKKDIGSSASESVAPCAQYGNEEGLSSDAQQKTRTARRKLMIACAICLIFLVAEFIGK